jgi:hypothetical protein
MNEQKNTHNTLLPLSDVRCRLLKLLVLLTTSLDGQYDCSPRHVTHSILLANTLTKLCFLIILVRTHGKYIACFWVISNLPVDHSPHDSSPSLTSFSEVLSHSNMPSPTPMSSQERLEDLKNRIDQLQDELRGIDDDLAQSLEQRLKKSQSQ